METLIDLVTLGPRMEEAQADAKIGVNIATNVANGITHYTDDKGEVHEYVYAPSKEVLDTIHNTKAMMVGFKGALFAHPF